VDPFADWLCLILAAGGDVSVEAFLEHFDSHTVSQGQRPSTLIADSKYDKLGD
jgi:hypothetical protein